MLQDTPIADAKPDDIKDLLGGALFKALFKWMQESGPVYLLPTGKLLSIGCLQPKVANVLVARINLLPLMACLT